MSPPGPSASDPASLAASHLEFLPEIDRILQQVPGADKREAPSQFPGNFSFLKPKEGRDGRTPLTPRPAHEVGSQVMRKQQRRPSRSRAGVRLSLQPPTPEQGLGKHLETPTGESRCEHGCPRPKPPRRGWTGLSPGTHIPTPLPPRATASAAAHTTPSRRSPRRGTLTGPTTARAGGHGDPAPPAASEPGRRPQRGRAPVLRATEPRSPPSRPSTAARSCATAGPGHGAASAAAVVRSGGPNRDGAATLRRDPRALPLVPGGPGPDPAAASPRLPQGGLGHQYGRRHLGYRRDVT